MNMPSVIPAEVLTEAEAASKALEAAQRYPVPTTADEYAQAGEELRRIKARSKSLEEWFEKLKAPVRATAKAIDDFFKAPRTALTDAEKAIKGAMLTYDRQQDELRREAERKAAEAARKEQERLRAEAAKQEAAAREKREAEERKAAEARAREEEKARKLAEAGRAEEAERRRIAAAEEEQRRREAAAEAERQRLADAEAARLAADTMPTAPVVNITAPKVEGVSTRKVWSAELISIDELIRAAAGVNAILDFCSRHMDAETFVAMRDTVAKAGGDTTAKSLLQFNQSTANKLAVALKDAMSVPGVRAVSTASMAARA